ncbi:hypothetical protein F2Q68_00030721 [Brassica cretica]|uniref:Uncharacterized protein n=5 Tax=Brassica TaxID=3705 RepID=A0ABQ7BQX1_BRACR|nr:hypothetical protein F2Q68_00030721 [Brassica cretica]KAF3534707.1 hypothetical protein DY000_02039278 [Brassica cretica]
MRSTRETFEGLIDEVLTRNRTPTTLHVLMLRAGRCEDGQTTTSKDHQQEARRISDLDQIKGLMTRSDKHDSGYHHTHEGEQAADQNRRRIKENSRSACNIENQRISAKSETEGLGSFDQSPKPNMQHRIKHPLSITLDRTQLDLDLRIQSDE